jgi:glyoxylase-like metal-dependent hydrolase (beta-lactamase superfamily II)
VILRQYLTTDPVVAASYLLGCGGKSVGAVVDPVESIDRYLDDSERLGLRIRYVVDTHGHADHLSGGRALAEATGAAYVLFAEAGATYAFEGVVDGSVIALGNVSMRVLHTPGHTPEHISLLVTDRTRSSEPWLLLSGHTLMVGDMGRTELASTAEEGARAMFATAERLRELADYVEVLPGAFSGSVCGRGLSGKASSTIGFERRFNRAFSIEDQEAFVRLMLEEIPPQPPRFAEIRAENLGIHAAALRP